MLMSSCGSRLYLVLDLGADPDDDWNSDDPYEEESWLELLILDATGECMQWVDLKECTTISDVSGLCATPEGIYLTSYDSSADDGVTFIPAASS